MTSTPTTGFTFAKALFFQSKVFSTAVFEKFGLGCFVMCCFIHSSRCKCFPPGLPIGRGNRPIPRSSRSGQMFLLGEVSTLVHPVKHQQCWFRLWFPRDPSERRYKRSKWSRSVCHLCLILTNQPPSYFTKNAKKHQYMQLPL